MKTEYIKLAIILGSGCITFLIFTSLSMFSFSYLTDNNDNNKMEESDRQTYEYKYMEYDAENEGSTKGFLSIFEKLEEDEFKSYEDRTTGNLILISNFEAEEFKCTGTCTCQKNNERRSTTTIIKSSKMLTYLVAAMTSFAALTFAKSYFEERCAKYFSEDEDCEDDYEIRAQEMECYGFQKAKETITDHKIAYEYFWCSGQCMDSRFFRSRVDRDELVKMHGKDKCSNLKNEGEIAVYVHGTNKKKGMKECARIKFIEQYLVSWCRVSSIHVHMYEWKHTVSGEPQEKELAAHLCVGQKDGIFGQDNPSVVCLEYPEGGKPPKTRFDPDDDDHLQTR